MAILSFVPIKAGNGNRLLFRNIYDQPSSTDDYAGGKWKKPVLYHWRKKGKKEPLPAVAVEIVEEALELPFDVMATPELEQKFVAALPQSKRSPRYLRDMFRQEVLARRQRQDDEDLMIISLLI